MTSIKTLTNDLYGIVVCFFFFKLLLYFDHISLICFKILRTVQSMKESINKYLIK